MICPCAFPCWELIQSDVSFPCSLSCHFRIHHNYLASSFPMPCTLIRYSLTCDGFTTYLDVFSKWLPMGFVECSEHLAPCCFSPLMLIVENRGYAGSSLPESFRHLFKPYYNISGDNSKLAVFYFCFGWLCCCQLNALFKTHDKLLPALIYAEFTSWFFSYSIVMGMMNLMTWSRGTWGKVDLNN